MEVKIGVTNANRELTLESSQSADDVLKAVERRSGRRRRPVRRWPTTRAGRCSYPPGSSRTSRSSTERPPDGFRPRLSRLSGLQAEVAIRAVCVSVSRANIRAIAARSIPGRSTPPTSSVDSASRSAATRCAWLSASPIEPARPQRQPAGDLRVRLDRRAHPVDRELGVSGVVERGQDQVAGRRRRDRRRSRGRSPRRARRRRRP